MSVPAPGALRAVVLAASRGPDDPVARAGGVRHKALVPVAGVAMLSRVLGALRDSGVIDNIDISIDDPAVVGEIGEPADPGTRVLTSAASPAQSVLAAAGEGPPGEGRPEDGDPWRPLLITTGDHPLLTPEMVRHFCREALAADADIVAGLASDRVVMAAFPDVRRTWLRFRDGRWSGCNLFAVLTPAGLGAVRFWDRMERIRKKPWRMALQAGPLTAFLALTGMLTRDGAMARLSRRTGARAAVVEMPFATAAVDVDKPADLELAERILAEREG